MDYTVRELIHNQSFRRMVKGEADAAEVSKWNQWIEADDEHRLKAKEAMTEIAGFEFKGPKLPDIAAEWDRLRKVTAHKNRAKLPVSHSRSDGYQWLYRVAAILLIAGLTGAGIFMYSGNKQPIPQVKQITQEKTVSTASNEQKTITFSNDSKIILNSHSKMTYQLGMLHKQTIKVHLQGEAYFEAAKGSREFAVYTPDGIVRDIGTKFMVTVQKDHSRVVLQAGKVAIRTEGQHGDDHKIDMKQGEMLSFNRSGILNKRMVNPTYYTSWATGFMHFDHTTIRKFAGYVEKKFDVNVRITDPQLAHIKIDGSIYFKSLTGLVRSISKVAMIPAYQSKDGKTVYLGEMNNY